MDGSYNYKSYRFLPRIITLSEYEKPVILVPKMRQILRSIVKYQYFYSN